MVSAPTCLWFPFKNVASALAICGSGEHNGLPINNEQISMTDTNIIGYIKNRVMRIFFPRGVDRGTAGESECELVIAAD